MPAPIYFSKIQFTEFCHYYGKNSADRRVILNIPAKELSLQVYRTRINRPAIWGETTINICGKEWRDQIRKPAYFICNEHTNFKPVLIPGEETSEEVIFSYGIILTEAQITDLLPYCNALEFESYRDKKMSMDDPGYRGYRDEISLKFTAITDSYIPQMEASLNLIYDTQHTWPHERLYQYIIQTFFEGNKEVAGWAPSGRGHILCWK